MDSLKTKMLYFFIFIMSHQSFGDNEITSFNGGTQLFDVKFCTNLFNGIDSRTARYGNSISSLISSPAVMSLNPAIIGFYKSSAFSLDIAPPLNLTLSSVYSDLDNTIQQSIDDAVAEMKSADLDQKMIYSDFDMILGQKGLVNSFSAVIYGRNSGNLGIGFSRKLDMNLNGLINGISTTISDIAIIEKDGNTFEEKILVPLAIESFMDMNFQFNEFNAAYSKSFLEDKLSVGFGFNILFGRIYSNILLSMDGIIKQASEQTDIAAIFNDPSVDYRNTLDNNFDIDFSQKAISPNFGVSYRYQDWLFLDFAFQGTAEAKFDGHLEIVQHMLGALDFGFDEDGPDDILGTNDDEEMLDMNKLKPSQITYTNETAYTSDYLKFEYPGYIANSIAIKKKWFSMILSYEKFIGSFSMHYKCDIVDDGQEKIENSFVFYSDTTHKDYKISLQPQHGIKVAFGFGPVSFGGQIILGDILFDGLLDEDKNPRENILNSPLGGSFAWGFGFNVTPKLAFDMNLVAVPGPIARTTFIYSF